MPILNFMLRFFGKTELVTKLYCCINHCCVVAYRAGWWVSMVAYGVVQFAVRGEDQRGKVLEVIAKTMTNVLLDCITIGLWFCKG